MQFRNSENVLPSARIEAVIVTVSCLLGVDMTIMAMVAVIGVVFAALLYVHAMCLVLGFFKALLNDLVVSLLDKLTSSFESSHLVYTLVHFHV